MSRVKTQAVITSETAPSRTPEAFLSSGLPSAPQRPIASPEPARISVPVAELPVATTPPSPGPQPGPVVQAEPPAPIPQVPPASVGDPFILLRRWNSTSGNARTLRAWPVEGGCIIKSSFASGSQMGESLTFVPGVKLEGNQLVAI